nr:MAG TPA: hypothetical protein [Caudoviricetes sp.]
MNLNELISKIEQWAEDRNIIKGSKPIDQAMKLFSEFGELADNVGKGRDCRDDIGDCAVVIIIISKQLGINVLDYKVDLGKPKNIKDEIAWLGYGITSELCTDSDTGKFDPDLRCEFKRLGLIAEYFGYTLEECLQIAYNDIKDRKGILWNGVFVKSTDESYQEVLKMYQESMEGNYRA